MYKSLNSAMMKSTVAGHSCPQLTRMAERTATDPGRHLGVAVRSIPGQQHQIAERSICIWRWLTLSGINDEGAVGDTNAIPMVEEQTLDQAFYRARKPILAGSVGGHLKSHYKPVVSGKCLSNG